MKYYALIVWLSSAQVGDKPLLIVEGMEDQQLNNAECQHLKRYQIEFWEMLRNTKVDVLCVVNDEDFQKFIEGLR